MNAQPVNIVGDEILRLSAEGQIWIVLLHEFDDDIVGAVAHAESTPAPPDPNIYWDRTTRHIDDAPDDLPYAVRSAIHRWMTERY